MSTHTGLEQTTRRLRRQAAKEARQAARARRVRGDWVRRLTFRVVGILILGGLVCGLGWWVLRPKPGVFVASQGNAHVVNEPVGFGYASDPPTSGPHAVQLAAWGVHEQPISKSLQVHNLEDGGVLVQYNCADCDELVSRLEAVVRRYPDKVILAPYPGMTSRIALTAWSYIDTFDGFDERRIVWFIEAHRGVDHHARGSF